LSHYGILKNWNNLKYRLKTNQVIDKENLAIKTCALVDGFLK